MLRTIALVERIQSACHAHVRQLEDSVEIFVPATRGNAADFMCRQKFKGLMLSFFFNFDTDLLISFFFSKKAKQKLKL